MLEDVSWSEWKLSDFEYMFVEIILEDETTQIFLLTEGIDNWHIDSCLSDVLMPLEETEQ